MYMHVQFILNMHGTHHSSSHHHSSHAPTSTSNKLGHCHQSSVVSPTHALTHLLTHSLSLSLSLSHPLSLHYLTHWAEHTPRQYLSLHCTPRPASIIRTGPAAARMARTRTRTRSALWSVPALATTTRRLLSAMYVGIRVVISAWA